MSREIADIEVRFYQLPMFVPFKVAYGTTLQADLSIVVIKDQLGRVGIGEAAPPSYLAASKRARLPAIISRIIAQHFHREPEIFLQRIHQSFACAEDEQSLAIIAIESALQNLLIQQAPLGSLSGSISDIKKTECATDLTIPLLEFDQIESFWRLFAAYNFKIIKVKVEGKPDQDIERLRIIDALLPADVEIFLDGNQGFDVGSACQLLEALPNAISRQPLFFEQPLGRDDLAGHIELNRRQLIPICLDESVENASQARQAHEQGACSMVNLKIMKSGIRQVLEIISYCQKHHIPMMIGGMVESEITMSMSLDLFLNCRDIIYADLDTPFFIKERLLCQSPWHRQSAVLKATPGPMNLNSKLSYASTKPL